MKNNEMIQRDMQISLARETDKLADLYVKGVREGSKEMYHSTEEIAILRKAAKVLYDAVVTQHPHIKERKEIAEMLEWFNEIEKLKASLRAELGMEEAAK